MDEREITLQNDVVANKLVAKCMRYTVAFFVLVWVLNQMGVFILDKGKITTLISIAIAILIVPTIFVNILKIQSGWVKFFNVILSVLFVNLMYTFLGYHVVLAFIMPTVVASLYFNQQLMVVTAVTNVFGMAVAHILSPVFTIVPDDPLILTYDSIVYGFVPRAIIFLAMTVIVMIVTNRSSNTLKKVFEYSDDISRNVNGLDGVVSQTQKFFVTRNITKLAKVVVSAVTDVVSTQQKRPVIPVGFVGFKDEDGTYFMIDQNGNRSKLFCNDESLVINSKSQTFQLPITCISKGSNIQITENEVLMSFYENDILIGCSLVLIKIDNHIDDIRHILDILYVNIKLAIINTRLNDSMFKNQLEIIFAFAEISESKSEQTGKHIKRVAEYMKVLGKHFGLNEEERDSLSIASMMHDIGKLLIPSEILEKPGKLTAEEFNVIKEHIKHGYALLQNSPGKIMLLARNIAYQHHEKWDGTGYMGMQGEEIDFYSRLMAVADVFDALVSRRSYKEKWTIEDAYAEIVNQSGHHFDPQVVVAFVECFPEFVEIVDKFPDE